jgi:Cu2+-exporting ATPase
MALLTFELPEITCPACVAPVEYALNNLGLKNFQVDLLEKKLKIETEHTDKAFAEAIMNAVNDTGTAISFTPYNPNYKKHLIKSVIGLITGFALLGLSASGIGLPIAAVVGMTFASSALSLYLGAESFKTAFTKLWHTGTLEMNALFAVSSLITIGASIASLFVPWMPAMLDAALLTFGFRHLGIAIEEKAKQQVSRGLKFQQRVSRKVWVCQPTEIEMDISEVKPGDIIRLEKGQIIPLDGILCSSHCWVNTDIINGAIEPQEKHEGMALSAGMKIANRNNARIEIKVTKKEEDSFLVQLDNHIALAKMHKAPLQLAAEKILKYFVPAIFAIATVAAIAIGSFFNLSLAIQFATSLLVSACPCTLGTIVPVAVSVGIAKAGKHGILFKSAEALETAAKVDAVVFDLTGTLTKGEHKVSQMVIHSDSPFEINKFKACVLALEKNSPHSIANAIRAYVKSDALPLTTKKITHPHHAGEELIIDNAHYRIGNNCMMDSAKIIFTAEHKNILTAHPHEEVIFIAKDETIMGYIILSNEALKEDASKIIQELKTQGKEIHICTGVKQDIAEHYAQLLNIPKENILANCAPADKTQRIKDLQAAGKTVAMIGDASNDAASLAQSDLGILVKSPANNLAVQNNANVVIEKTSLLPVINTFKIAEETVGNIKQNLAISFTYNFATLGLSSMLLLGFKVAMNAGAGVAFMVTQASLVLLNVYRFSQRAIPQMVTKRQDNTNNALLHQKLGFDFEKRITRAPKNRHQHANQPMKKPLLQPDFTPPVQQIFSRRRP